VHIRRHRLFWVFLLIVFFVNISACAKKGSEQDTVESKAQSNTKQLKPLMHKGKPFFPIGAYGQTRPKGERGFISFSALRKAGWNTVLTGVHKDAAEFRRFMTDAEAEGFAIILAVGNAVKRQDRDEVIREVMLGRNYSATLGYYIFDEPENIYSKSDEYKKFLLSIRNIGEPKDLGSFIIKKISWVGPLIRQLDPDPNRYIFMCIAWPKYYKQLQPFCQVNMPNEYPTRGTSVEFEGPHATIVYDARMAGEAAFEKGAGRGFCYTPFAVNIGLEGRYRYPTINEFRYSAFAPITQGAMGIIYWAGYRCKQPYTERVVFPVTRELGSLKDFFLGEWLDGKLKCEPSDRKTKLLKKLDVPAISGCLRQHDDGRYLLLAVNNTAKPIWATFQLALERLPNAANEFLSARTVKIDNGVIKDAMDPYGVGAYIIEPR